MSTDIYGEVRVIAEGVIQCRCGNSDWTAFIYTQGGPGAIMGGCKKCGRTFNFKDGKWNQVTGPAPGMERKDGDPN